ncbi:MULTISPECIES: DUF2505 domain-containing protein [Corynebacterium]|uniref:DUF2505 domain-containing protein n=2 Tax=Corynebacterium glucuronolyticum TaxID=39791 RepID=A0A7T4EFP7_9CORY|nr:MULTISPECIES: DUF2505 domain-containing protein [Corynebacterium]EEI28178.1 hypothetical protein HMPREF0294_0358 [Corynebacterium glucuronolyticum ATCC 51867]EEI63562.1 hypothetical protein HMPREF0293_0941 [Corynebacterium glucuronolyticum ATCC 51866]MCT1442607.1 DUF2505 domain-containing protein [Corynebacterium glucuronolyticum]MCT1563304.1 DUF2505 domain-containing protein [Corynebacterium glucuronolyticum]OFO43958.1 hypothetical protein HMPREF3044_12325 [Corynebacterium sp. HMSC073D01]
MTARNEVTVTIPHSKEKVLQAWRTQEFWDFDTKNLSTEPGEVHEFNEADGKVDVALYEVMPMTLLPEAVQGMISQDLKIKRTFHLEDENTASYHSDVKGTPVDFGADIAVSGEGDTTTLTYSNTVDVKIPFMGAAIEPKVAEALEQTTQAEADLLGQWISDNL